jgi:hypothetical protein
MVTFNTKDIIHLGQIVLGLNQKKVVIVCSVKCYTVKNVIYMSHQMLNNIKVLITHFSNQSLCALQSNQYMKWIAFPLRFKSTTYAGR